MMTPTDYDAVSALSPSKKLLSVNKDRDTRSQTAQSAQDVQEPKYDSLSISEQTSESRFQQELVSRLEKEVRTAVSTGDIQELRQAVEEDRYVPDPMRLAARILLLDEEDV